MDLSNPYQQQPALLSEGYVLFKPEPKRTHKVAVDLRALDLRNMPAMTDFWDYVSDSAGADAALQKGKDSLRTYKQAMNRFLTWLEESKVQFLTEQVIKDYKRWLQEPVLKKRNGYEIEESRYSPSTAKLYFGIVKRFFSWTAKVQLIPDVTVGVSGIRVESSTHKKERLPNELLGDMLSGVDRSTLTGCRDYAMILTAVECALRRVEIHEMRIGDVFFDDGFILVRGKGYLTKTKRVNLPPSAARAIKDYLAMRPGTRDTDYVFVSHSRRSFGQQMCITSISHLLKNHIVESLDKEQTEMSPRKKDLQKRSLSGHSLRHTGISLAAASGQPLASVRDYARHRDISVTSGYIHTRDEDNPCSCIVEQILMEEKPLQYVGTSTKQ